MHHLEGKILRAVLGPQDLPLEGLGCSQAGILSHDPFMTPFMTLWDPLLGYLGAHQVNEPDSCIIPLLRGFPAR